MLEEQEGESDDGAVNKSMKSGKSPTKKSQQQQQDKRDALDRYQCREEWNDEAENKETQQNILAKLQSTIKKKVVGGVAKVSESLTKSAGERAATSFGLNLSAFMSKSAKKDSAKKEWKNSGDVSPENGIGAGLAMRREMSVPMPLSQGSKLSPAASPQDTNLLMQAQG